MGSDSLGFDRKCVLKRLLTAETFQQGLSASFPRTDGLQLDKLGFDRHLQCAVPIQQIAVHSKTLFASNGWVVAVWHGWADGLAGRWKVNVGAEMNFSEPLCMFTSSILLEISQV